MMWWHPLISLAIGWLLGCYVVGPLWRRRKRRKQAELDAWRHQQRVRG